MTKTFSTHMKGKGFIDLSSFLGNFMKKALRGAFFLWIVLFLSFDIFGQEIHSVCPIKGVDPCRNSLSNAVKKITSCASSREVRLCSEIFVRTLSDVDPEAPFYEGVYHKKTEDLLGDKENYKKTISQMKDENFEDPEALLALYNLAKALIIEQVDFDNLTPDQMKNLEDLVEPEFQQREFRSFSLSEEHHREDFINYHKLRTRSIRFPGDEARFSSRRII